MGRALEPGVRQFIILDADSDKPAEQQPKIYFPALSIRKSQRIGMLMDEFAKAPDSKQLHEMIVAALSEIITGWDNFKDPSTGEPIAFTAEAIWDWLTIPEAYEIMQKVLQQSSVSSSDQKKSE
jgi:hypothetical protein